MPRYIERGRPYVGGPIYNPEYHRRVIRESYRQYSDKHLKNALNFSSGCAGEEADMRVEEIRKEIRRRKC